MRISDQWQQHLDDQHQAELEAAVTAAQARLEGFIASRIGYGYEPEPETG